MTIEEMEALVHETTAAGLLFESDGTVLSTAEGYNHAALAVIGALLLNLGKPGFNTYCENQRRALGWLFSRSNPISRQGRDLRVKYRSREPSVVSMFRDVQIQLLDPLLSTHAKRGGRTLTADQQEAVCAMLLAKILWDLNLGNPALATSLRMLGARTPRYDARLGKAGAAILSGQLAHAALRASKELKSALGNQYSRSLGGESLGWQTVFEFTFLLLHVADRIAFQVLGRDSRGPFMDDLANMTFDTLMEAFFRVPDQKMRAEFKASLLADLNERNADYSVCQKLLPSRETDIKDTLFWRFGEVIAETLRHSRDESIITAASSVGIAAFNALDIKNTLETTLE